MDNLLTQKTPTGIVIAQTIGITASMFLLGRSRCAPPTTIYHKRKTTLTCRIGSNTCLSVVGISAAMQAPAPLAVKQWYTVLTRGGGIARPLAILSALATGYVTYHRASNYPHL